MVHKHDHNHMWFPLQKPQEIEKEEKKEKRIFMIMLK